MGNEDRLFSFIRPDPGEDDDGCLKSLTADRDNKSIGSVGGRQNAGRPLVKLALKPAC